MVYLAVLGVIQIIQSFIVHYVVISCAQCNYRRYLRGAVNRNDDMRGWIIGMLHLSVVPVFIIPYAVVWVESVRRGVG